MTDTARLHMTLVDGPNKITGAVDGFREKVNAALTKIDATAGRVLCTSSTRPTTNLYPGMEIYETDTKSSYVNLTGVVGDWRLVSEVNYGVGRVRTIRPIRSYGGDTAHSAFPDVVNLTSGKMLMTYRQGTNHSAARDGIIRKATSDNHGRSWTAPTTIATGAAGVDLRDPCVSLSRDGLTIYLTYFKGTAVLAAAGVFWRASTDGGVNWSAEVRVDGASPYAASSAKCIELDNGTLVIPYYGRAGVETLDSVWLAKSTTGGATWTQTRILNGPTAVLDFQEPWMVLKGQTAVIGYRHGNADNIGITVSTDNTANWSGASAKFAGTGRPTLFFADDISLCCIYRNNATSASIYSAMMRTTLDNGTTWSPARILEKAWNGGALGMTYAGVDRVDGGASCIVMGQESSTTLSRIFVTYGGRAGVSTPFGSVPEENDAVTANADSTVIATQFEQSDGTIAYPWFVMSGAATVTNGEVLSASADNVPDLIATYVNSNDMEVEAEIKCGGTGTIQTGAAIIFRMIDASNYLMFTVEGAGVNYRLYKVVAGVASLLERNGNSPGALFDYNVGVRTLPVNQYVKYRIICREAFIWVYLNDQWIVASAGAGSVFPSAMLSTADQSAFSSGKFAGFKLNSQSTSIHSCRRFTAKI
jgi:hypothetical protein